MIGIYKIISPSGKTYIGQSIDIERRWNEHKNLYCTQQPQLYNSLKKYGWELHHKEIIEECDTTELNDREYYYKVQHVQNYGWDNALFCELYDNGTGPRSQNIKDKISKNRKGKNGWPKGKPQSEETKNKKRLANQGRPKPEGFGLIISLQKKGKPKPNQCKPIVCINTGETFTSIQECAYKMNLNIGSISQVLTGKYKKTKAGYTFKYIN